jgi:hypothetical protein
MMNIKLDSSQSDTYPFVRSVPILSLSDKRQNPYSSSRAILFRHPYQVDLGSPGG